MDENWVLIIAGSWNESDLVQSRKTIVQDCRYTLFFPGFQ